MLSLIDFTNLNEAEKKIVFDMRNHPSIRKWMYNKNELDFKEHLDFILSLKKNPTKKYFLVKEDEIYLGVIDFKIINQYAEIGLYKNPKLKGVGKKLLKTLIDYGFNQLRLNKLILFVFENNKRAILLYKAFGFKIIQKKQNLIKMELKGV